MKQSNYLNVSNLNQHTDFPYLVIDIIDEESYPRSRGFRVMHWHEDLQFVYVHKGRIEITTLNEKMQLEKGQGAFINRSMVHRIDNVGRCHYNSIRFPIYFLEFYLGSPIKSMVHRFIEQEQVILYVLDGKQPWHPAVLDRLQQLCALEQQKDEWYAYEVLVLLNSLWLILQKNMAVKEQKSDVINERIRLFLHYIEAHYHEDITLYQLAASAQVSESECLRCFRDKLDTTPMKYLSEYRLSKAADLLINTTLSINDIAERTGFHQLSYFGKCFKDQMKCAPRIYRKQYRIHQCKPSK
ncbi:MAG: AraC family transcriptional regulator [Erysipelotrichaceae bacterium]|nr:AraC family transcriptional regulator [Erysipelotrichaceae bacterium]